MEKKVYVTGIGIVSALGAGCEATLRALKSGKSGIEPVKYLSTQHSHLPVGEVKLSNGEMAGKLRLGYPYSQLRTVLLGIMAAKEAIASAGMTEEECRHSVFVNGTTVGGMDKTERHFNDVFSTQAQKPDALELQYNDCGVTTELIADQLGGFKFVTTTSTACSSAANALIFGANMIKTEMTDMAVVGGSEALSRFHLNGFNTLMILDNERCRPFKDDRAGINLGEGAAYLVLESEESIKRSGHKPIALLAGYANTCDAFHQTATSDNGEGPYLAMRKALDMARLSPADIDYINAHGTGTPNNDRTEMAAMERIWGDRLPAFASTKSLTGHTTSASGSIESVISLLLMRMNGLRNLVNNSFGFGGNDTTLVFSNINEETR